MACAVGLQNLLSVKEESSRLLGLRVVEVVLLLHHSGKVSGEHSGRESGERQVHLPMRSRRGSVDAQGLESGLMMRDSASLLLLEA